MEQAAPPKKASENTQQTPKSRPTRIARDDVAPPPRFAHAQFGALDMLENGAKRRGRLGERADFHGVVDQVPPPDLHVLSSMLAVDPV